MSKSNKYDYYTVEFIGYNGNRRFVQLKAHRKILSIASCHNLLYSTTFFKEPTTICKVE